MSAATGAHVALRIRTGLEAVDLGFAMAQQWWRPLAATWLVLAFPIGLLILFTLRSEPLWALFVLWWLRPVFARVPLHVLSERLFGRDVSVASTLAALPRLARSGLLTSLFLQRVSFSRSFLQPVLQLEGLRGAARRKRCAILVRQDSGAAFSLMTAVANLNGLFVLGLLLFVSLATPSEVEWDVMAYVVGDEALPIVVPALYLLGISVFEPLYVAGGFGLYLNRRVFLEGWEIEIAFRNLAARTAEAASKRRFAAAATLTLVLLAAAPAFASDCVPKEPSSSRDCIGEVLADGDFGSSHKEMRWVPKKQDEPDAPDLSWLAPFIDFLAKFAQILLWGGLALALLALAFSLRGTRFALPGRDLGPVFPRSFMGLDLDPRSLPPALVEAAREAWRRGEAILALSLLYRGALVRLGQRGALEIPNSATEFECLRMVRRTQAGAIAGAFADLTGSWIRARYAHEAPSDAAFEALCAGFAAFEEAA